MSTSFDILRKVTTATITTMLLKKGIRHCWIKGSMPMVPGGERLVGPAFTLRFVPVREDLATPESWGKPISTRAAIEAMPEGCIAVADAMGVTTAGIFGDILVMRMAKRGVTALVTDGVIRDKHGCLKANMPIFCQGTAAPASVKSATRCGARAAPCSVPSLAATRSPCPRRSNSARCARRSSCRSPRALMSKNTVYSKP